MAVLFDGAVRKLSVDRTHRSSVVDRLFLCNAIVVVCVSSARDPSVSAKKTGTQKRTAVPSVCIDVDFGPCWRTRLLLQSPVIIAILSAFSQKTRGS